MRADSFANADGRLPKAQTTSSKSRSVMRALPKTGIATPPKRIRDQVAKNCIRQAWTVDSSDRFVTRASPRLSTRGYHTLHSITAFDARSGRPRIDGNRNRRAKEQDTRRRIPFPCHSIPLPTHSLVTVLRSIASSTESQVHVELDGPRECPGVPAPRAADVSVHVRRDSVVHCFHRSRRPAQAPSNGCRA